MQGESLLSSARPPVPTLQLDYSDYDSNFEFELDFAAA